MKVTLFSNKGGVLTHDGFKWYPHPEEVYLVEADDKAIELRDEYRVSEDCVVHLVHPETLAIAYYDNQGWSMFCRHSS
jgi:hypothetical protein